jgi:hypothetical protein
LSPQPSSIPSHSMRAAKMVLFFMVVLTAGVPEDLLPA